MIDMFPYNNVLITSFEQYVKTSNHQTLGSFTFRNFHLYNFNMNLNITLLWAGVAYIADDLTLSRRMTWSVLPFWPKHRLGHPENY